MVRNTQDQALLLDDEIQDMSQQHLWWGPFRADKKLTR